MCKPLITQDGYDSGLMLECLEHKTREPVVDENGTQVYNIDILKHIDMLVAHRAKHETPFFEQLRNVEATVQGE